MELTTNSARQEINALLCWFAPAHHIKNSCQRHGLRRTTLILIPNTQSVPTAVTLTWVPPPSHGWRNLAVPRRRATNGLALTRRVAGRWNWPLLAAADSWNSNLGNRKLRK